MSHLLEIENRLREVFEPTVLTLHDESHLHTHHATYQAGKLHLVLHIQSEKLTGKQLMAQHRAIHEALAPFWSSIHALQINVVR